jgi:hypothetical protein
MTDSLKSGMKAGIALKPACEKAGMAEYEI